MSKKILISLAVIGIVAGITLGITSAFWTDEGVSENQSFVSGSLNLRLSNDGTSGTWGDNVSQTWSVDKMVPGGTPYVSTLYMKNNGSVNADYLKFTLETTPSPAGMDKVMRITELKYKGESLLTGGAGADLDGYVAPTDCTVTLSGSDRLQAAINAAAPNDVICTTGTDYSTAWEGAPISVNQSVAIASMAGPATSKISAGLIINMPNVTIKGFTLTPTAVLGETVAVYLNTGDNTETTIIDNDIDGMSIANSRGIIVATGGTDTKVKSSYWLH